MRVVIAGGHGQIALILERLLAERGDTAVGLVRNPAHVPDLEAVGASAEVLDLERTSTAALAEVLGGADAVVFAAGAGPGSGAARKQTVDRDAAILLADAAEAAGVPRYVMVSAISADDRSLDDAYDEVYRAYIRAKAEADADVRARSGLHSTIVRPGRLTDDAGTGRVHIAESTGRGEIPRADVAAVLLAVLDHPDTAGRTFELIAGDTPISALF
ncbi:MULTISPECIES: NAD(P)H-binding protein [Mycobacteriaceae]|uniref:NAD-dependent dehydratase n=1 Tax=Mycolicibacterium neoaurum VKM Ac-1815D TaxID=700508 RepID=V5XC00_MYCNE|nr:MULTISPECIES: NAD(P)H-binding protein [Mycobacteriaceae]AHC25353.1 NAD-dependent dehydratase [Mycolicibacterium neoaurum VKM Ac-1815D]AMO05829.1 NAD-dependent dehydratase [Mycolicibacterium neoaurum]AXK75837.1 NAD-dependent epimerase/dehydratase family protein [Mycolicibacterium neoaurum]KJQ47946.1 NAD-dependent dehydratase [Mycolicibacterium neoaurum]KUM05974.1 NAD-dependent dehydratase [Mycolicibacterium neoaurum]